MAIYGESMNNYGKCKYRYIIQKLNEEYIQNGASDVYIQNLNSLLDQSRHDGDAIIFIFRNLKCKKFDAGNLTSLFEQNIINLKNPRIILEFAKLAKLADFRKLTRAMCKIASIKQLCEFACIKGVRVEMIIDKLAGNEQLNGLRELGKFVPVRYKKQIRDAIIYLKNDGVIEGI